MSTNYSLSHDIQNNLNKELPNQNKAVNDHQINLAIKQKRKMINGQFRLN